MGLTFLVGGVRSGKSRLAARLAASRSGQAVVVIATGEARDDEMAERIKRHRDERPAAWQVIEEPLNLDAAIAAAPVNAVVIVDCLTLWVSNLLEHGTDDDAIEQHAATAATRAASRSADTVAVSNEVGLGIIPMNALARRYTDMLGRVNAIWAAAADRAAWVIAGRALPLPDAAWLWEGAGATENTEATHG